MKSTAALAALALFLPATASGQPIGEQPLIEPDTELTPAPAEAVEGDPVVDLDGTSETAGDSYPLLREQGLDSAASSVAGFASLPPSLDRSGWSLPAGSAAPTDDLSLWEEDCYRFIVADEFDIDPREAPSVLASLEAALSTHAD